VSEATLKKSGILFFRPSEHLALWGSEIWEISNHAVDVSIIDGGEFDKRRLYEVVPDFPLLVKTIRANRLLSVQVHPNEHTCRLTGGEPKTEMWFALSDGYVYAGFKRGTTPTDVESAIRSGTLVDLLVRRNVRFGDVVYIPGGMVHAIGGGTVLYEVQQNSVTTFRLYDWNRIDPTGKSRQLHIDAALKALDYSLPPPRIRKAVKTPYFDFQPVNFSDGAILDAGDGYLVVYVVSGEVKMKGKKLKPGTSFMVLPGVAVKLTGKDFTLLLTRVKARSV
jgi:mannose-6-phosphate isomerase